MAHVLIVDPAVEVPAGLVGALERLGHSSKHVVNVTLALRTLEHELFHLVLVDAKPGEMTAAAFVETLAARLPGLPAVLVARESQLSEVVAGLRAGAADILQKHADSEEVEYVIGKALAGAALAAQQPPVAFVSRASRLIGDSEAMQKLRAAAARAAPGNATILIRGETGTGKEMVARAVHEASARQNGPFMKIDCASLPDTLLESELFGYERGAFTGAATRKLGRVELADGGSLFLDEIGEVSTLMQSKLLRLLQDRQFEKLGGRHTQRIDVRFILATHRDLETMVQNGSFREDLFYRLNVVPLWIPPLRARRDDIEPLARAFCARFAAEHGKEKIGFSPGALRVLRSQRWPGNVRQLENFVERLVVLSDDAELGATDIERALIQKPEFATQATQSGALTGGASRGVSSALDAAVRDAERSALLKALEHAEGNRTLAARVLGVSRSTLYTKLKELGIDTD
jgi:two-component system, NtrC family, response regulator AtoC